MAMRILITVLVICLGVKFVDGSECSDLSGTWRNQLGSNMTIQTIPNSHRLTGRYYTAVESTRGAARLSSNLSGMAIPVSDGSLVAFNVLWNKGASLTAWVGQCIVCGGKEKIYTSWVLRSLQPPLKNWMSTRINQDTFWRVQDGDQVPQENTLDGATNGLSVSEEALAGTWTSSTSDNFTIYSNPGLGSWEGIHDGSETGFGGKIYGVLDGNATYNALGFVTGYNRPDYTKIIGWTGHVYNLQESTKVMETSWLKHSFENDCTNPRKDVQFGMDNYSHMTGN